MTVKIGVVQAASFSGEEARKHTGITLDYIEEGAEQGIKILCFPEGYPGPFPDPVDESSIDQICAKAKDKRMYVIVGGLEQANGSDGYYTCAYLIGPEGKIVGTYRRIIGAGPKCYRHMFGFGDLKLVWGNELPVFATEYGNVGILICSEVYTPELARVLALKGADIIFFPSGGCLYTMFETWKNQVWARAIENIVYTATHTRVFGVEDGVGTICSPEEILAESTKEGILTAEMDLDRLTYLRENDFPGPIHLVKTHPAKSSGLGFFDYEGQPISRRPELFKPICMSEEELKELKTI